MAALAADLGVLRTSGSLIIAADQTARAHAGGHLGDQASPKMRCSSCGSRHLLRAYNKTLTFNNRSLVLTTAEAVPLDTLRVHTKD